MHMDHSTRGIPAKRKQDHDDDQPPPVIVPKRPRLDAPHRLLKKPNLPIRPPPIDRLGNDVEDIGILPNVTPGPSTGSLLHLRRSSLPALNDVPIPIDSSSLHIPSVQPYISRQTLKELDLETILRNPQLRHDLLFDYGLQFRPTSSRRKRQVADAYWSAVIREVEAGCTCFPVDKRGHPVVTQEPTCVCSKVTPPATPVAAAYLSPLQITIIRTPSRIRPLLTEFLEVVLLVIQPLQSISSTYVNPDSYKTQMEEHTVQANYIRSIFDPSLIEQELRYNVFDLASLMRVIGGTLKGHCAPMRDQAVEAMVQAAEACKPGGRGTKTDAVNAVRACMDILELMKLDIANHQLQTIRASMARTSANYELASFRSLRSVSRGAPLSRPTSPIASQWLSQAWSCLNSRKSRISHPLYSDGGLNFTSLGKNRQVYLAALKGLSELAFYPPFLRPPRSGTSPGPNLFPAPLPDYPETLYLDHTRLKNLTKEIGDVVALYMLLLLYRQLLYSSDWSDDCSRRRVAVKVDDTDLAKLKNEIQAIGSARLYANLNQGSSSMSPDSISRFVKEDMVLQVVMRAQEARCRAAGSSSSSSPSSPAGYFRVASSSCCPPSVPSTPITPTSPSSSSPWASIPPSPSVASSAEQSRSGTPSSSIFTPAPLVSRVELAIATPPPLPYISTSIPTPSTSSSSPYFPPAPDPRMLNIAQRWAEENMNISSSLGGVVYHKLHEAVFQGVVAQTYPGRDSTVGKLFANLVEMNGVTVPPAPSIAGLHDKKPTTPLFTTLSGMEPLAEEIKSLVEKISRLALVHLNVYLPVYEQEDFVLTTEGS
ncbi:Protein SOSEKI 1 [Marasmius tenuissimus]|uniref:Protein SOSEKI 1 n=1 Tax=Marasmius tenuissimus TaxID=585030 RepID=A0ABR3A8Q8_9AGAR